MALFVGASLFVLWHWRYSVAMIMLAALVTAFFVEGNGALKCKWLFPERRFATFGIIDLWVYSFRRGTYSRLKKSKRAGTRGKQ